MLQKDKCNYVGERIFTEGGTSAGEGMLLQRTSGAAEMKRDVFHPGERFSLERMSDSFKNCFRVGAEQQSSSGPSVAAEAEQLSIWVKSKVKICIEEQCILVNIALSISKTQEAKEWGK